MLTMAIAERTRFRDTLTSLTPQQWTAPSLCEGWTVRHVAGHLASASQDSMGSMLRAAIGAKFDIDEVNRRNASRWAARGDDDIINALSDDKAALIFRMAPAHILLDIVVHHLDICRPLELAPNIGPAPLVATLNVATKRRARGLTLVATDLDWRREGGSHEVSGPAYALLLAVMGRKDAYSDLSGVEALV